MDLMKQIIFNRLNKYFSPNNRTVLFFEKITEAIKNSKNKDTYKNLFFDMLKSLNAIVVPEYSPFHGIMIFKSIYKLNDTKTRANIFKLLVENLDIINDINDGFEKPNVENHFLYDKNTISVNGNSYFFHGTPYENYKSIFETGYLKFTNYVEKPIYQISEEDMKYYLSHESNKVFLTDDFVQAVQYSIKTNGSGVVLCFDLDGLSLTYLYGRFGREFISENVIPINRLRKLYRVDIIDNEIIINEMEIQK